MSQPSLQTNKFSKKNLLIGFGVLVLICLVSTSVAFYYLGKKTNPEAKVLDNVQNSDLQKIKDPTEIIKPEPENKNPEVSNVENTVPENPFPWFLISGYGYKELKNPKAATSLDDAAKVNFTKILDQNNNEVQSSFLDKYQQIIPGNGKFYITYLDNNKEIGVWNPKDSSFSKLEMPIQFGDFKFLNGKFYLSEYNKDSKCGNPDDQIGNCAVVEVEPSSLATKEIIKGVKQGYDVKTQNNFAGLTDKSVWLYENFWEDEKNTEIFREFNLETKKLVNTIEIQSEPYLNDNASVSSQAAGKNKIQIAKLNCNVNSGCEQAQKDDFNNKKFTALPKEVYETVNPVFPSKINCQNFEYDENRTPVENFVQPLYYKDKNVLELKSVFIYDAICVQP